MKYGLLALAVLFGPMLLLAPIIGMLADPWAPFRFSGIRGDMVTNPGVDVGMVPSGEPPQLGGGFVTDAQRYLLARAVGFSPDEAILATAISIAEDGSGNPAALSGENTNHTFDLGLWQINSSHWAEFGGKQALIDPLTNAHAAYVLRNRQGWCAWATYLASCGIGHTGSFAAFMDRARRASIAPPLPGEA